MTERTWMNTQQAADYIGCSAKTIRRNCETGQLPARQLTAPRGRWRIHIDDLNTWMRGKAA